MVPPGDLALPIPWSHLNITCNTTICNLDNEHKQCFGRKFKSGKQLRQHIRNVHGVLIEKPKSRIDEEGKPCPWNKGMELEKTAENQRARNRRSNDRNKAKKRAWNAKKSGHEAAKKHRAEVDERYVKKMLAWESGQGETDVTLRSPSKGLGGWLRLFGAPPWMRRRSV